MAATPSPEHRIRLIVRTPPGGAALTRRSAWFFYTGRPEGVIDAEAVESNLSAAAGSGYVPPPGAWACGIPLLGALALRRPSGVRRVR